MAPESGNVFKTTGNMSARKDVTAPTTLCRPRLVVHDINYNVKF